LKCILSGDHCIYVRQCSWLQYFFKDAIRLPFASPNKIRHFLKSIFPARPLGRPWEDPYGSGRVAVDKAAQRRRPSRGRLPARKRHMLVVVVLSHVEKS
jgi:hypothetical protein